MRERITTFILVSLVTLTIWLYAEAESLGTRAETVAIEFVAGIPDLAVRITDSEWNGQVRVQLSGSRSALDRARTALESRVTVQAGTMGLPDVDADTRLKLTEILRRYEPLLATGVTVESAEPAHVGVQVRRLIVVQAPIRAELPSVQVSGDVTITPSRAELRVPERLWEELDPPPEVLARPTAEQLAQLAASGAVALQVNLRLPPRLEGVRDVSLITKQASLSFSIKSTLTTAQFAVPVQLLLPSIEQNEWVVAVDPQSTFLDVEVAAPAEIMDRLKSPEEGLIAVLSLSSDDLAQGISSKDVSFAILRQGVAQALPDSVRITAESRSVRFTAAKREGL